MVWERDFNFLSAEISHETLILTSKCVIMDIKYQTLNICHHVILHALIIVLK